jgi:hypothetical protein
MGSLLGQVTVLHVVALGCYTRANKWVCSLGYDPRPTPSLLRVGMKLSDQYLLKTAEPLIIIINSIAPA